MSVRTDVVNLNVNVNGDAAKNQLNQLRTRAADLTFEMKGLTKGTVEYQAKAKELSQVNDRMASLRKEIGLTALSQKELTKELQRLNQIKGNLTPGTEEFKNMQKQIDATKSRLTEVRTGLSGFKKMWSDIGTEVKQFGMLAAAYLGFEFITSGLQHIISGAGKTSDSLAQLQIYLHGSAKDAQDLYQALRQIDTRTSNKDLLDIAAIVAKKGVVKEEIVGVTKALDQLFVVLGTEIGDPHEAVASLVKLVNVYSEDHHVTAKNISDIGAAIQGLTSSGVATGDFLISFAERLAGVRGITGITIQSVLGLGAALQELGQRNESASTAAQKLILQMFLKPADYAKSAGLAIKDFSALLAKDPVEALIKVAATLKQTGKAPEDLIHAFGEMGVNGARVIGVLGDIAGNADYMRKRTEDAYKMFGNASSIAGAFAIKNETLGATLDKIGKKLASSFTSSTLVTWLKEAAVGFGKLVGVVDNTNKALDDFNTQKKYVADLTKEIVPLIQRYDELGSKALALGSISKLAQGEQKELQLAIQRIADTIPTAITQFDKYGRAISISSDKARDYIRLQQAILQEENRKAIESEEKRLKDQQALANSYQSQLNSGTKIVTSQSFGGFGGGGSTREEPLSPAEIKQLQINLGKVQQSIAGIGGELDKLKGKELDTILDTKPKSGGTSGEAGAIQQNTERTIAAIEADVKRVTKAWKQATGEKKAELKKQLDELKVELAHAEGKQTTDEKKAQREADRKAKAAEKAMETGAEKLKRFEQQLQKNKEDLEAAYLSDDDKKIQAVTDKYQKIQQAIDRELHGKKGNLLVKMADYAALVAGFGNAQIEELNLLIRKSNEARGQKEVEALQKGIDDSHTDTANANNGRVSRAERAVILSPKASSAELDAHKALLRAKFIAETEYLDKNSEAYKTAQAQLNKDLKATDKAYWQEKIAEVGEVLQGLNNVFSSFVDLQNQKDDQQLANDKATNDKKRASYDQQLKKKLISQQQFDDAIAVLDADMDRKQKEVSARQAKRNKAAALFGAILSTAMGVAKALADYAWPYNLIVGGLVAAAGAIQIAKIESQEVPKGRKGLVVQGASHEQDGIDMVERRSGRTVANIEGGEPVMVLSKNTYGNNKGVIDELIYNSQYRNGAAVAAASWYGAAGPRVNTGRIIPLMRGGGVAGTSSAATSGTNHAGGSGGLEQTNALMQQLISEQQQTRTALSEHNKNLKAYVVLQDYTDAQTLLDKAKSVAGVNQKAA